MKGSTMRMTREGRVHRRRPMRVHLLSVLCTISVCICISDPPYPPTPRAAACILATILDGAVEWCRRWWTPWMADLVEDVVVKHCSLPSKKMRIQGSKYAPPRTECISFPSCMYGVRSSTPALRIDIPAERRPSRRRERRPRAVETIGGRSKQGRLRSFEGVASTDHPGLARRRRAGKRRGHDAGRDAEARDEARSRHSPLAHIGTTGIAVDVDDPGTTRRRFHPRPCEPHGAQTNIVDRHPPVVRDGGRTARKR
ncbi:hypothetical protein C8R45DRAFT_987611 [Mycena sanguinolenta]|nr:hypothetical protein C8R45DRAFT_1044712 [Mycena sanguinolenta]KAJ6494209.1 hypothetical protein C8R45DRAFT_987611 [Mycena sanguinolenta]